MCYPCWPLSHGATLQCDTHVAPVTWCHITMCYPCCPLSHGATLQFVTRAAPCHMEPHYNVLPVLAPVTWNHITICYPCCPRHMVPHYNVLPVLPPVTWSHITMCYPCSPVTWCHITMLPMLPPSHGATLQCVIRAAPCHVLPLTVVSICCWYSLSILCSRLFVSSNSS